MAQRLVGVLCQHCKMPHAPTQEERHLFERRRHAVDHDAALFHRAAARAATASASSAGSASSSCSRSTTQIRELVRGRAPTQAVLASALEAGMRSMAQDGLARCLAGITTLEEVLRVTEEV